MVAARLEGSVADSKLCQNLSDDLSVHVGESPLDPVVVKAEALVIEAEEVQDGGVKIVDRGHAFDGPVAEVIGCSVAEGGLHAGPGHPGREALGVVVATAGTFLKSRHASEFGAEDHQGIFEQTREINATRTQCQARMPQT